MKPRLLDLFCGAGGASMGYARAGFEVVGVDNKPQPHYPFEFHQADAMSFPLDGFDVIHASPPCQGYSITAALHRHLDYPKLISPIRDRLRDWGGPYIIENVAQAAEEMPGALILCGQMFGLRIFRHRLFELTIPFLQPGHTHGKWTAPVARSRGGPGSNTRPADGQVWTVAGNVTGWRDAAAAMGVPWMGRVREVTEAIPPAYTEYIGRRLLEVNR